MGASCSFYVPFQAGFASLAWLFFAQLGEPAKKRVGEEKEEGWLSLPQLVDRQGGFDIFGILDGALNYGIILRTIVMNIIAVKLY